MENLESKINEEIKKRDSEGGFWSPSEYFHSSWENFTNRAYSDISSADEISVDALINDLEVLLDNVRISWEIEKRSY
jgi:hypothetical protein